jgi:hypothetical protein
VGASVVACGDAAPVFEAAECVLDAVALSIERAVVRYRDLPLSGGRDAGLDASRQEVGTKARAIVAAIAEQLARLRENRQEHRSAFVVVGLACGQQQADEPAFLIADSVKFRVQPAAGASDAA